MAFDPGLAQRLRELLYDWPGVAEKKMFGGLTFLINGNMCVGVMKDYLMARVGPHQYKECLTRPHAREMDFTGKPLTGFVCVDQEGLDSDEELMRWIETCMQFAGALPPK